MNLSTFTSIPLFKIHNIISNKIGYHKDNFLLSLMLYLFISTLIMAIILIPIEIIMYESLKGISFFLPLLFGFLSIISFISIYFSKEKIKK